MSQFKKWINQRLVCIGLNCSKFKRADKFSRLTIGIAIALASPVHAMVVEEVIKVPVVVKDAYFKEISQNIVVTIFRDNQFSGPLPIVIINHGRAVRDRDRQAMGRATYKSNATWLAEQGFLVAVPTRVGYGVTGGDDVEYAGGCDNKNYVSVYAAAAHQTISVINTLRQRSDVDQEHVVVMGQSFGGTTAITMASLNISGVVAAINFAGGGGGDSEERPQNPCSQSSLERLFANYGKTSKIPTLWVYTENDMYFGPKLPKQWFDAFKEKGGSGEYILYPALGKNGHGLFTIAPDIWRPKVLEFLFGNGINGLKPIAPAPL